MELNLIFQCFLHKIQKEIKLIILKVKGRKPGIFFYLHGDGGGANKTNEIMYTIYIDINGLLVFIYLSEIDAVRINGVHGLTQDHPVPLQMLNQI